MDGAATKRFLTGLTGRYKLSMLVGAAALTLFVFAGNASASLEDDLPNGRLGYKWTPEPPSRPLTQSEELGLEVAKYGGGGLIGLWLLRKIFSNE
jgi:hypothetical protein